jgi:uncharacterized C2H2 Zn-finger protein
MKIICFNYRGPAIYNDLEYARCNICGTVYKYNSDDIIEKDGLLYLSCPVCRCAICVDSKVEE